MDSRLIKIKKYMHRLVGRLIVIVLLIMSCFMN